MVHPDNGIWFSSKKKWAMQLFFCFISFQKELAASPLPSNLSAEPPLLPPPWQKIKENQLEWKPRDSVCSTQGILWTVHKEVLAGNFEKDWKGFSPYVSADLISCRFSSKAINLKTIGAATTTWRLMPSALPATLYSLSQILITTQGQSLENTHYIENCDSEPLSHCSKVKQLLSGKLDRHSLFHLLSDSALFFYNSGSSYLIRNWFFKIS